MFGKLWKQLTMDLAGMHLGSVKEVKHNGFTYGTIVKLTDGQVAFRINGQDWTVGDSEDVARAAFEYFKTL